MKRFIRYAFNNKKYYIASVLMLVVAIGSNAIAPKIIKRLVNDVIVGGQLNLAFRLLAMLIIAFVFKGFGHYLFELFADYGSVGVIREARNNLFQHLLKQDQDFFRKNAPGELMSRVKSDTENVGWCFGFVGLFLLDIVANVVVMLICLFQESWVMGVVCLLVMPIIGFFAYKEEKKVDKLYGDISEENATMNKTAGEALSGIRTVKAFNKHEFEKKRFAKRNKHYYALSVSMERVFGSYDGIIIFFGRIMLALSVLVAGFMVMKQKMDLGSLASGVEYVNNLTWPMMEIGWVVNSFSNAFASSKKIEKLYEAQPKIANSEGAKEIQTKGNLCFKNVSFSVENKQILNNVSFNLEAGKTLGIMGSTGSGKSTITNLALRFLDPVEGEILLDGVNAKDISLDSVRDSFAIVTQDVFLFSDTIMKNIKIGANRNISDEEAIEAAKMAHADEFIVKLDDGYQTVIGEKGVGLSGGQKQRLCLTRAFAKKAPILVLDDATSALDMETESEVQRDLENLETKHSTIIIAHRISAVRKADEIIYLEKGSVVERGDHQSLMALKGRYYETFVAQYSEEEALCR